MNFVNETGMEAAWTVGFEPDGRELLVVVIKATFRLPANGETASLAEEQVALTEADEFTGEPGSSATLYESDFAHRKPYCDVLVNGSAYAPGGKRAKRVGVGLRIGSVSKSFNVVGTRVWDRSGMLTTATPPEPFERLPISYDCAFGGVDIDHEHPEQKDTFRPNPVGVGYYPLTRSGDLLGKRLPNTEQVNVPIDATSGRFVPMSFGPIGRNFEARIPLAGTYDQEWLDFRVPFWPRDFDYKYFQSAPADQQIPYPKGGEWVMMQNLTPDGIRKFQLPELSMPVFVIPHRGQDVQAAAAVDTVLIEPDHDRFMLTWRASLPLRRDCFEVREVIVGERPRAWLLERKTGKTHYSSVDEFLASKRGRPEGGE